MKEMKTRKMYERPSMRVVELKRRPHLLVGSGGTEPYTPDNNPYSW